MSINHLYFFCELSLNDSLSIFLLEGILLIYSVVLGYYHFVNFVIHIFPACCLLLYIIYDFSSIQIYIFCTREFFYGFHTQIIPWKPPLNSHLYKTDFEGFLGGAVVENPPANGGDMGSSPGPGRSHMPRSNYARVPQLLSLCSRALEPQLLSPRAQSLCSTTREATAMRNPRTATKTQHSQK